MSNAHQRGFTLIEMLTVIAILIILTGILFANFRNFGGTARLEQDAIELASLIRSARQDSISVVQYGSDYPSYGIYINEPSTIELYAACNVDLSSSGSYHRGGDGKNASCSGANEKVQGLVLSGSTISDIAHSDHTPASFSEASVLFIRPNPIVQMYVHPGGVTLTKTGTLTITLTSTDGTDTRTVSVNSNGHIRIGN